MIKAPESLHEKIRALFRPFWKGYVDSGNERAKKLIEAELSKRAAENKVLSSAIPIKLGGAGTCPTCGEIVSNLAFHAARCKPVDPILKELARAELESNIKLDPARTKRTKETERPARG